MKGLKVLTAIASVITVGAVIVPPALASFGDFMLGVGATLALGRSSIVFNGRMKQIAIVRFLPKMNIFAAYKMASMGLNTTIPAIPQTMTGDSKKGRNDETNVNQK